MRNRLPSREYNGINGLFDFQNVRFVFGSDTKRFSIIDKIGKNMPAGQFEFFGIVKN